MSGRTIKIGSITWSVKPTIHRVCFEPAGADPDPCSQLVGEFMLAGCTAYVATTAELSDVLGDYIPGGPT